MKPSVELDDDDHKIKLSKDKLNQQELQAFNLGLC